MKDTILVYCLPQDIKTKIEMIGKDLNISVSEIAREDVNQTMGYLLQMDGYSFQEGTTPSMKMEDPFVFFALNNDEQLDLLLQMFRMKGIPFIPYKAVLTQHNVHYRFVQLYQSVAEEYLYMTNQKPQ